MKQLKIYKSALTVAAALLLGGVTIGCSDWDDHYDANTTVSSEGSTTLLQNIKANSNLSHFAALLERSGFASSLDTTQVYTVWAPVNDSFDYATLSQESNSTLLKEFIENHVARYTYGANGTIDENVLMLNEKMNRFAGSGSYTFGGINVAQANLPSSNGLLHTLSGMVTFYPSIYEYLDKREFPIDSIADYIHHYDEKYIDESNSLQGPMVNGQVTYLDTVWIERNLLCNYITIEDSSYTMLLLTNNAWNKASEKLASYFNYVENFTFTDPINSDNTQRITIDTETMTDSMVHYHIVRDIFFNNRQYDHAKLAAAATYNDINCDSLVSVSASYYDPTIAPDRLMYAEDAKDLFYGAEKRTMSNGYVWVTDSFRMKPWNSWAGIMTSNNAAGAKMGTLTPVRVGQSSVNPETGVITSSSLFYYDVKPTSSSSSPEIDFYLGGVLSTTYNIYGVFVPANVANLSATNLRPNYVTVTLGYNNEKGQTRTQQLGKFTNDSARIDTVFFGEFTFPMCYRGTGYYPYIRVRSSFNTSSESDIYDNEIRMAGIILVPKELDDYLDEHPDYKFYTDND